MAVDRLQHGSRHQRRAGVVEVNALLTPGRVPAPALDVVFGNQSSSRGSDQPEHASVLGAEVARGDLVQPAGAGLQQQLQMPVEVLQVEERHGEPRGQRLQVYPLVAEDPVGRGDLPGALHLAGLRGRGRNLFQRAAGRSASTRAGSTPGTTSAPIVTWLASRLSVRSTEIAAQSWPSSTRARWRRLARPPASTVTSSFRAGWSGWEPGGAGMASRSRANSPLRRSTRTREERGTGTAEPFRLAPPGFCEPRARSTSSSAPGPRSPATTRMALSGR